MTATLTDLQLLTRAVCLDPADDLARLAYADACDEAGLHDRAEFIRVQVEYLSLYEHYNKHARHDGCAECERATELSDLLLGKFRVPYNGPAWFAPDCPWRLCRLGEHDMVAMRVEWDWWRGFVGTLRVPLDFFMSHVRELFSRHPITEVVLADREPGYEHTDKQPYRWFGLKLVTGESGRHHIPYAILGEAWKWYDSREAALEDLPRLCVRYGRNLADLPPLEAPR